MIAKNNITLAVISDLHAFALRRDSDPPSYCDLQETDSQKHAVLGLLEYISKHELRADVLVCPGDLCDRAEPAAMDHGWGLIQRVKTALGSSDVFVTTGNHDVDSRHDYNDFDAKGRLQELCPPYPFDDESLNDRYWSRNFVVIDRDEYRLVVLNSSAFHGQSGKPDSVEEFRHGRVSPATTRHLVRTLQGEGTRPLNVLLCHHHPHQQSEHDLGASDTMRGGQDLLDALDELDLGQWLIIHGHKHHPKMLNARGAADPPIVFSAGSASARLFSQLSSNVRNQFYILDLPVSEFEQHGLVGTFDAWSWRHGIGWDRASMDEQLPGSGGFGFRGPLGVLANRVRGHLTDVPSSWDDLKLHLPELSYLFPADLRKLKKRLIEMSGVTVQPSDGNNIILIGRST